MAFQQQSALMQVPTELLLSICEYALIEDEPILINCPCDSSFDTDEEWEHERDLWRIGEKRAPSQPGLSQTCTALRDLTLPIFYGRNIFRAFYCERANVDEGIAWLAKIGTHNRQLLGNFGFWDMNPRYDKHTPAYVKRLKRSEVCRAFGGRLEKIDLFCHHIRFADDDDQVRYLDSVAALFGATEGVEGQGR